MDLTYGSIRLKPGHIKSNEAPNEPLNLEVIVVLRVTPISQAKPIPPAGVFIEDRRSVGSGKRAFTTASKNAKIEDCISRDLKHTAINNWRLQGQDFIRIMAASR